MFLTNPLKCGVPQCVHFPKMNGLINTICRAISPSHFCLLFTSSYLQRSCLPFELLHVVQIAISYGNSLVSEWLLASLWSHIMSTSCILTRTWVCLCSGMVCSGSVQINLQNWQGLCHYLTFHHFLHWLQIWQALSLFSLRSSRSMLNDFGLMRFLLNFQKCFGWDDSSTFTLVFEKQQLMHFSCMQVDLCSGFVPFFFF